MLNVLLVEDNPADVYLFEEHLEDSVSEKYIVTSTDSLEKAWYLRQVIETDIVVIDLSLPKSSGDETLFFASRYFGDKPVIVLTGSDDLTLAKKSIAVGVQSFLVKKELNGHLLSRSIQCAIERHQLAREAEAQQRSLAQCNEQLKWVMSHRYG